MDLRGLSDHSIRSFAALQSAIYPLGFVAILAVAPLAFCQQGTIMGAVVDSGGAFVARAQVKLSLDNGGPNQETQSAHAGEFSFSNVPPGPFHLSFGAEGFALKTIAGELHAGETLNLPQTALAVASVTTEVNVTQTQAEIAETQIKVEEQQRIIGIIPNYFVTYNPVAAPLNTKQKSTSPGRQSLTQRLSSATA